MQISDLSGIILSIISNYLSNKELCCLVRTSQKMHSRLISLRDVWKRLDKKSVVDLMWHKFSQYQFFKYALMHAKKVILSLQQNNLKFVNCDEFCIDSIIITCQKKSNCFDMFYFVRTFNR